MGEYYSKLHKENECVSVGSRHSGNILMPLPTAASKPIDPFLGKIVKNYKLTKLIGKGSYGSVYAAIDVKSKKKCAIKVQDFVEKPRTLEEFEIEADFLKQVKRIPEAIRVFDAFRDKRYSFLVLELCQLGSLEDVVIKLGGLSSDLSLYIFERLVKGIKQLHDLGICHRDLKALNVLIGFRGKLLKFQNLTGKEKQKKRILVHLRQILNRFELKIVTLSSLLLSELSNFSNVFRKFFLVQILIFLGRLAED